MGKSAKPNGDIPIYVSLYLDHPKVGCGERQFLVLKKARKWTDLLCISTFDKVTIPSVLLDQLRYRPLPFKKTPLDRRLRENARVYAAGKGLLRQALAAVRRTP